MRKKNKTKKNNGGYEQGTFHPVNKNKYHGTRPILYRSSYEKKMMQYLDNCSSCISWKSETVIVRYTSPLDKRIHRYFIDFEATFRNKKGEIQTFLIEVKPKMQVSPPKNKTKTYEKRMQTYLVNSAKWDAAKKWAEEKGKKFIIITENELFCQNK